MERNFMEMVEAQWARGNFVCVGLDSDYSQIPGVVRSRALIIREGITKFNKSIVDATMDLVCAYKPNIAFYEAHGQSGLKALRETISHIHRVAPDVLVILDAKRGDIGNTNTGYVQAAFTALGADAITINPYLGAEAMKPFLDCADKGIFVLCRTSNPGAGEFQDLLLPTGPILINDEPMFRPLYQYVALRVVKYWNTNSNCALVVGATYPEELTAVRKIVGDMPILIPGIGAQGGDVEKTVTAGKDSRGAGFIVNASRSIIFASDGPDFAEAARRETLKLHDLIKQYR